MTRRRLNTPALLGALAGALIAVATMAQADDATTGGDINALIGADDIGTGHATAPHTAVDGTAGRHASQWVLPSSTSISGRDHRKRSIASSVSSARRASDATTANPSVARCQVSWPPTRGSVPSDTSPRLPASRTGRRVDSVPAVRSLQLRPVVEKAEIQWPPAP